ncbi:hypothetical protein [Roseovarius sp.]|uniref:hypothetical protein n=1 Tax=Roseovarius sp. TaxID=1486281 RepID=UPI003A976EA0
MSTVLRIPPGEAHVVRLFAVDEDHAAPCADEEILKALGAGPLKTEEIELFDLADLQAMTLSDYLTEGHGIAASEIAPMLGQVNGLRGRVLILPSRAFEGHAQEMRPRTPLRLIGRFSEDVAPVRFTTLPTGGAEGVITARANARPRGSGRLRLIAFSVLALLAVGLALAIGLAVKL